MGERRTFAKTTPTLTPSAMSQRNNKKRLPNEAQIQLELQAIQQDMNLFIRHAAEIYEVAERTLRRRRDKTPYRQDGTPNSMKLTKIEEEVIVQHILKLNEPGYPP